MKTTIGNWETDFVTDITPKYCRVHGYYLTQRQIELAGKRMHVTGPVKFRFVPVQGAKLADVFGLADHVNGCEACNGDKEK